MSMSKPNPLRSAAAEHLSVIHKAVVPQNIGVNHHAVIQTDLSFNITGWNTVAEELNGQPGSMGKNLFDVVDIEFTTGTREEMMVQLSEKGFWSGEVRFTRFDRQQYDLYTTATYIINEKEEPVAIMIVSHIISDMKLKERQLEAAETKFEALVNTFPDGVMILDAAGRITTCNKRCAEIFGLTSEQLTGYAVIGTTWKAIKPDGTPFPVQQFPAVVSLQTGFPQRNVIMGIELPGGNLTWLSLNSEALLKPGEFEPYGVVVSFSDISNLIAAQKELLKSNERFHYVTRITSDAIWDFDLVTHEIYRSENFCRLSGYSPEETGSNLNWWFDKIHPEDQERVKRKLDEQLLLKNERWEDEYRFEYADGTYKILIDSGLILYKDDKPVRILGAIRDITEKKMLKRQLADEQAQKQKEITHAALQAQEEEKHRISRELHDNVNQILMSAKLYMETARQSPEKANMLLDKAVEYQLLALHEIRKLSRSLNTPGISTAGLQDSISDIVHNLQALQQIKVDFIFETSLEDRLNDDEKLTLYRVVQEQTSNIIKYAAATRVKIMVQSSDNTVNLLIEDNGEGFDASVCQNKKGIGIINMNSRASAHGGTLRITSLPGRGCRLELSIPF